MDRFIAVIPFLIATAVFFIGLWLQTSVFRPIIEDITRPRSESEPDSESLQSEPDRDVGRTWEQSQTQLFIGLDRIQGVAVAFSVIPTLVIQTLARAPFVPVISLTVFFFWIVIIGFADNDELRRPQFVVRVWSHTPFPALTWVGAGTLVLLILSGLAAAIFT